MNNYESVLQNTMNKKPIYEELEKQVDELNQLVKKYQNVVEDQSEFIVRWLPNGIRTFVNSSYCRFYGKDREELIGTSFFPLIDQADFKKVQDRLNELTQENPISTDIHRVTLPDGRIGWNQWTDRAIFNDDGVVIEYQSVGRDITEQKRAEEKLYHYEYIVANSSDMMALLDKNFVYLAANESYATACYKTKEELIGLKVSEVFGEKVFEEVVRPNAEKCFKGENVNYEEWFSLPNKEKRYLSVAYSPYVRPGGEVAGFVVVSRDISDSKQVEEDLRENKTILESFLEHSPVYIFFKDHEIRPKMLSRNFEQMLGMPLENVLGKTMGELFPSDLAKKMVKDDLQILKQGKIVNVEEEFDGRIYETTKFPIRLKGRPNLLAGFTLDITERKQAEKEKAALEARLQQSQKMEAIGTMAGGIAHDFNNILAVVLGFADLVKDTIPDNSPARNDIEQVLKAGERAKELVNHILTFSRMSSTAETHIPINISSIVKEVVKFLRSIIPTTIEIQTDIDNNCGQMTGDPTQIHQVIMNFCTNALYVMEETGGSLGVGLCKIELTEKDIKTEPHLKPGTFVKLSVSDTGEGMDQNIIGKIFDPYFTTKAVGKGSGLGLAVVHGIVNSHGGFVKVESYRGKGSIFNVFFPSFIEGNILKDAEKQGNIPTGTERILFIDDEELLVNVGKTMLEKLGYTVTPKTNSSEAIELFCKNPGKYDIVITDQTMPYTSGADLAKLLLGIRPDIPIILCTGYSSIIDKIKAQEIGIREFIMKPYTKYEIARLIRKTLDEGERSGGGAL